MKQQTAMQEMLNWIRKTLPMDLDFPQMIESKAAQLLEKEKEQIMKAARECHFEGVRQSAKTSEDYISYGEEYFNQTYNN